MSSFQMMLENDEKHLLTALKRGDETAFDALFRTWYAPLVRFAAGFFDGDADEAEDLVQQAFVELWQQRERLEIRHSFKAFLYRSVHNRALNRLRSEKVRDRFRAFQTRTMPAETPPETGSELEKRFRETLEKLPPQCRAVFELSRFEQLKYREIADQLGLSIKTVETHMGRALRVFRLELADWLAAFLVGWTFFQRLIFD